MTSAGHTYSNHQRPPWECPARPGYGHRGAVAQRLAFDEWGDVRQDSTPGFQPFGFAGREPDPNTGLVYMRAPWYWPGHGRFISARAVSFRSFYLGSVPGAGSSVRNHFRPTGLSPRADSGGDFATGTFRSGNRRSGWGHAPRTRRWGALRRPISGDPDLSDDAGALRG